MMHKNKSVDVHQFAMVPRADVPRSAFLREWSHKTTFDAGYLVPIMCDEVLPGDSFKLSMTAFCRLATPIYPIMDNLHLETFFFFVPMRLVWDNWQKFMGEQASPADSISYTIPQVVSKASGYDIGSLQDYFGLPTAGQVTAAATVSHSTIPLRMYNRIYQDWFKDENLQNAVVLDVDDGPDLYTDYTLLRRGKRHDYFTSALPWPQKGGTAVSLPLGTRANIKGLGILESDRSFSDGSSSVRETGGTAATTYNPSRIIQAADNAAHRIVMKGTADPGVPDIYADLSTATAATINQLRQAFQVQKLLERDARGGTRYTEVVRAHFGVISPDARLQRPEYLGGGRSPVIVKPIAQTSGTSASGTTTPLGNLAAVGTAVAQGHGFTQSFTEHGYVIGLVNVRADLTYQQGLERHWSRSTRYDYYFPAFAMLGEQSILNKEIYVKGDSDPNDALVFGYQERWAELRYKPAMVTGKFRSTATGTLDGWHLAQKFTSLPTLNSTFIQDTPPVSRVVAVNTEPQFLFDSVFTMRCVRPIPMYSVPGLIDHF